jgi:carboxymethylenebutenolidase
MAEITTQEVSYPGKAGNLKAYIAHPAGEGARPVVIVVQEWWGLNENIKDIARRFANEGYFAIAPDLYSRQGNKVASDPNTAAQLMGGLKTADGIEDLNSTISWVRAQKDTKSSKIGITGYCMGGTYATLLPCESKEISAAAPFYGEIPSDDKLQNLNCPMFYAYGANDGWIQRPDVERLGAALKKFGKKGEAKIYEGCDHGFFNDTRKDVYAPDAAKDAWQRTLKLFAENLKG